MSHGKLRKEKICQNCGNEVTNRFCTHCGQENIETRQSFVYLITHFVEDFTHYDNNFWHTIKSLFFKPGELTKKYLEGKRNQHVAPVKLYIFISFITFFLIAVFPTKKHGETTYPDATIKETKAATSHRGFYLNDAKMSIRTIEQLDSVYNINSNMGQLQYTIYKKAIEVKGINNFSEKIKENLTHNIPKMLFIYLPIFAFFLWLFHNKKKWWFFDHGIFTLHYFSFLLLVCLLAFLFDALSEWINLPAINSISSFASIILVLYAFCYFFIAQYRVYKISKKHTVWKSLFLLGLNFILMVTLTLVTIIFTIYTIH
ncbi:MAG: DUF3667 domain-containing protein [Paludibacteraceae bacterium]